MIKRSSKHALKTRPTRARKKARTTPAKKKTRRGVKRPTKNVSRSILPYIQPLNHGVGNPKIPDGKANLSLGATYRDTFSVSDGTANPTTFLLVPALGYGVVVQNDGNSILEYTTDTNAVNVRHWQNFGPGTINLANVGALAEENDVIDLVNDGVAHWRCVSVGMKISLLNTTDFDDGWWEACSYVVDDNTSNYQICTQGPGGGSNAACYFVPNFEFSNQNLANERSYTTGLLRDLHKQTFMCKPSKDNHPFIDTEQAMRLESTDGANYDATDIVMEFANGSPTCERLIQHCIDRSFQMVLVRCHGRGSGAFPPSMYHVTTQGNYEFIYDRSAVEAKYQTIGDHEKAFDGVNVAMRSNPSPATVTS